MITLTATTTTPTAQPMAAILNMMELAQQRNTQPQQTADKSSGYNRNGSAKPVSYTVEAVFRMMAMAQQQYQR